MNKIVTVCGSMRFQPHMMAAARELELRENCIVIQCIYFEQGAVLPPEEIRTLNALHREKIRISDAIFVVNPGGYIGETTKEEIAFARSLNKEVLFLEPPGERGL